MAKNTKRIKEIEALIATKKKQLALSQVSTGEAVARGVEAGIPFATQARAGVSAFFESESMDDFLETYRQNVINIQEKAEVAKQAKPKTFKTAEVGAGLGTAFIPGLGPAKAAAGAVKGARVGANIAKGAGIGATFGAGQQELAGSELSDKLLPAAKGAALGGVVSGIASVLQKPAVKELGRETLEASPKGKIGALVGKQDPTVQVGRMAEGNAKAIDILEDAGVIVTKGNKIQSANQPLKLIGKGKAPDLRFIKNETKALQKAKGKEMGDILDVVSKTSPRVKSLNRVVGEKGDSLDDLLVKAIEKNRLAASDTSEAVRVLENLKKNISAKDGISLRGLQLEKSAIQTRLKTALDRGEMTKESEGILNDAAGLINGHIRKRIQSEAGADALSEFNSISDEFGALGTALNPKGGFIKLGLDRQAKQSVIDPRKSGGPVDEVGKFLSGAFSGGTPSALIRGTGALASKGARTGVKTAAAVTDQIRNTLGGTIFSSFSNGRIKSTRDKLTAIQYINLNTSLTPREKAIEVQRLVKDGDFNIDLVPQSILESAEGKVTEDGGP